MRSLGLVVPTGNPHDPNTLKAEAEGLQISGQPELQREILSLSF